MSTLSLHMHRDAFGRLVLTDAAGVAHVGITPVRAFPIAAPLEGVSLVGSDGKERVWIGHLDQLTGDVRDLIEAELAMREFMPVIQRIKRVSTYSTPSVWDVDTDRGATQLVLKGEEDIRRLTAGRLLVADSQGIQFVIADRLALDRQSRRILERFL
jgi:Domain of unknown function (DUF1854)